MNKASEAGHPRIRMWAVEVIDDASMPKMLG
jgi:hypothetical protein